jgi:hypothetical protein
MIGRGFLLEELKPGGPKAVLLSDNLFQRRFGADPAIISKAIALSGQLYSVVGVLPASFHLPLSASTSENPIEVEAILSAPLDPAQPRASGALARLKPGVTFPTARRTRHNPGSEQERTSEQRIKRPVGPSATYGTSARTDGRKVAPHANVALGRRYIRAAGGLRQRDRSSAGQSQRPEHGKPPFASHWARDAFGSFASSLLKVSSSQLQAE